MQQNGQDESLPAEAKVHLLHHGIALCGLEGIPAEWADGQTWLAAAYLDSLEPVTCDTCRAEYIVFFPKPEISPRTGKT